MTFNLNWTPINPFRLIYRCELRAHEHDGHHRFWGFTTPCCTAGTTDHWLRDPPSWTYSGGWALSHDHHEQCPAKAGNLGKGSIIKPQYFNEKKQTNKKKPKYIISWIPFTVSNQELRCLNYASSVGYFFSYGIWRISLGIVVLILIVFRWYQHGVSIKYSFQGFVFIKCNCVHLKLIFLPCFSSLF